jgi:16S rRNA (uracil1498-N3)-methyltransferase
LGLEETRHLRNVLRLKAGDEIFLFDGAGREYQGEIATIGREFVEVNVIAQVAPASPESPLNLTLATALLKGEKFDLVIQKATELGVTRIIPVITSRADVRIKSEEDADRKVIRWQRIALEATKQCGRARLIEIERPMDFAELIKTPRRENELHLMFAERAGASLATALGDTPSRPSSVSALIGPEGGWADDEIETARAADWEIVTFGGRTLRAETAAIAIAALIQHRFGDLK